MQGLLLAPIILLGLMLSLVGCFNSEPCSDPICQAEALVTQWQDDPAAAEDALLATTDPIAQIATLRALSEHQPATLSALCPKLSGMPAQECTQLSGRPHLWDNRTKSLGSLPVEGLEDPWADLAPLDVGCSDDSCRLTAALAASSGAEICASIEAMRWRQECFFRLAEQARSPAQGAQLCLGAGTYVDRCLGHISKSLATPPLGLSDAGGWQALTATIDEISAVLPESLAERATDRIYAESLLSAYTATTSLTGEPLDHLPERAHPHIHAALAHRMMADQTHVGLQAWQEAMGSAQSRRGHTGRSQRRAGGLQSKWKTLLPGEEELPWVAYLRDQRRVRGSTPEADMIICLLEANMRRSTPDQVFLSEAARSDDPLVRWTVARTLEAYTSSSSLLATLSSDLDPLVRQRARYRQTR